MSIFLKNAYKCAKLIINYYLRKMFTNKCVAAWKYPKHETAAFINACCKKSRLKVVNLAFCF